jgi:hypothetical protein
VHIFAVLYVLVVFTHFACGLDGFSHMFSHWRQKKDKHISWSPCPPTYRADEWSLCRSRGFPINVSQLQHLTIAKFIARLSYIYIAERRFLAASKQSSSDDSLKASNNGWFVIGTLCWTLSIVWGIFDIHDVSGVVSTPVFRSLVVMILTIFIVISISEEPG